MSKVEVGDMIILDSQVFVITELDIEANEGSFKYFKSEAEASRWLKGHPDRETDAKLN